LSVPTNIVEALSISHAQICDGVNSFFTQLAGAAAADLDIYGVNDASLAADTSNYDNNGDDTTLSRWNWLNFATVSVQGGYLSFPMYANLSGRPLTTTVTGSAVNEVQSLSSNGASAGTYKLSFRGQTTATIAWNAAAAAVQSALEALSTVGTGGLVVTGGPSNTTALTITAGGSLAGHPLPLISIDKTSLTGASGGVVTRTTAGATVDTSYQIDLWHEDSINVSARPLMIVCPSRDSAGLVRRLVIGLYKVQFGPLGFDGPTYKDGLKINFEGSALQSPTDETGAVFADGKKRIGTLLSVLQ
jgi:hypothetical protein